MPPAKPRIWPIIVFGAFFVPITWSMTRMFWSMLVSSGVLGDPNELVGTTGFVMQGLVFEAVCLGALVFWARHSREKKPTGLGLVRGRLSLWLTPLIYIGALGASLVGGLFNLMLLGSPSPRVGELAARVRAADGGEVFALLFTVAFMAAFAEELIFRGFIQRRLLRRFSPWVAIWLASFFFAIAHGDLRYALSIFPVGLWFGYVAFLAESTWPSMLCHFVYNAVAVVAAMGSSPEHAGAAQDAEAASFDPSRLLVQLVAGTIALSIVWWMARILQKRQRAPVALVRNAS